MVFFSKTQNNRTAMKDYFLIPQRDTIFETGMPNNLIHLLVIAKICCFRSTYAFVTNITYARRIASIVHLAPSGDLNTNFESLLSIRRTSPTVSFFDPNESSVPSPPSNSMGFIIEPVNEPPIPGIRLPIYPISAVHLPSDALHTLHNVQQKNIQMAYHLQKGNWRIKGQDGNFFINTLVTKDTNRLATIGTLMEVVDMEEVHNSCGELMRIRVECKARGLVKILGVEPQNEFDYMVGRVEIIEQYGFDSLSDSNDIPPEMTPLDIPSSHFEQIIEDYAAVRDLYMDENGVGSRELPPFARDKVQTHLSTFTLQDILNPRTFWNVAECWQMLCNTIREARRSNLQSDMNEIMIESEMKKGGMLKLPIKREKLGPDVQAVLNKMEVDACEDFHSLGMDPCLNFQILIGMCEGYDRDSNSLNEYQIQRLLYLGRLISRERRRVETKGILKVLFDKSENTLFVDATNSTDTSMDDFHFA
jgi:hypothetical protein